MAILTPEQAKRLGTPPKPLPPQVPIADEAGHPTKDYHQFLTAIHEWQRRLIAVLTE